MDLKGVQRDVHEWISKYGVRYFDELTNMVQEMIRDIEKLTGKKYIKDI